MSDRLPVLLDPFSSSWRWAWAEAKRHRGEFWLAGVVFAVVSAASGYGLTSVLSPFPAGLLGIGAGILAVLLLSLIAGLVVAPFQQRNRLRELVRDRDQEIARRFDAVKYKLVQDTVDIDTRRAEDGGGHTHVGIRFINLGPEVLRYWVREMRVTINDVTDDAPKFSSDGAVLVQNQRYYHWFPWLPVELNQGGKGTLSYTLDYGHVEGGPRWRVHHEQEFEALRHENGDLIAHLLDVVAPTLTDAPKP